MSRERNYEKLVKSFEILHITSKQVATYTLTPSQRTVLVDEIANGSGEGDVTIVMPPLDGPGVPGTIFSIKVTTVATNNVLILDGNSLATLFDLDTSTDYIVFFSDGLRWIELVGQHAGS